MLALAAFAVAAVLSVLFRSPVALVLTVALAALYFYPHVALPVLGVAIFFALTR